MQLVLELLKKIFIALQGVYTKQETDSALAVRDTNIATNTANIAALMTAIDSDWKTFMLARAGMTGIQKNIDTVNRAIAEYNADNTAALPNRLIEDWTNLYVDYEAWLHTLGEPSPLDAAFWAEYFVALAEWEADPTASEEWTVTANGDGTYSSTCPYFEVAPETHVVNFAVSQIYGIALGGGEYKGCFASPLGGVIYAPNVRSSGYAFTRVESGYPLIFPKATSLLGVCQLSRINAPMLFGSAITLNYAFNYASRFNSPFSAKKATGWTFAFASSAMNQPVEMSSATNAPSAFSRAKMSAENISATLDTLPAYTSGTHTITFTGCPGALELTQDSPSVASAVARGWTVEL